MARAQHLHISRWLRGARHPLADAPWPRSFAGDSECQPSRAPKWHLGFGSRVRPGETTASACGFATCTPASRRAIFVRQGVCQQTTRCVVHAPRYRHRLHDYAVVVEVRSVSRLRAGQRTTAGEARAGRLCRANKRPVSRSAEAEVRPGPRISCARDESEQCRIDPVRTAARVPRFVHSTSPAPAARRCPRCWRSGRTGISPSYPIEQTPTSGCICNSTPSTDARATPAALPSPAGAVVLARANAALSELVQTNSVVECRRRGWSLRPSGSRRAPAARSAVGCWCPPIRAMSSSRIPVAAFVRGCRVNPAGSAFVVCR